jgi:hypothetical protein
VSGKDKKFTTHRSSLYGSPLTAFPPQQLLCRKPPKIAENRFMLQDCGYPQSFLKNTVDIHSGVLWLPAPTTVATHVYKAAFFV